MASVPVLFFSAVGVKVILKMHRACGARDEPQLLLWVKSPVIEMLVMSKEAVPVLVSSMAWGELVVPSISRGKEIDVRERPAPATVAVPVNGSVRGLPEALSATVKAPVRFPATVGAKLT